VARPIAVDEALEFRVEEVPLHALCTFHEFEFEQLGAAVGSGTLGEASSVPLRTCVLYSLSRLDKPHRLHRRAIADRQI
jgi:hypothetical protein